MVPAGPISTCMDSHTLRSDKKRLRDKTVVDSFSFLIELFWWYRVQKRLFKSIDDAMSFGFVVTECP